MKHPVHVYNHYFQTSFLKQLGQSKPNLCGVWFWRRRFFKVFTIYEQGGHLSHVTCTIYINFHSHCPRRHHINLALIGQAVSEKMFENNGYIHVYSPGAGADNPLVSNIFINSIIMPPTLKKWGTYWFRLVRVCVCVCVFMFEISS